MFLPRRTSSPTSAFTMAELLIVMAILGLLAVFLLSANTSARMASKQAQCLSNLRQIGVAAASYSADHGMSPLPPNFWTALSDQNYLARTSPVWLCPADDRPNKTVAGVGPISYAYNGQKLGLPPTYWTKPSLASLLALTNPSGVVYFSDATAYWMNKVKGNQNADFRHGGKINALFFDGHAQTLSFENRAKFYELL